MLTFQKSEINVTILHMLCAALSTSSREPRPHSNRRSGHLGSTQKQLLSRPNYNRTTLVFFVPNSQENTEPAASLSVEERAQLERHTPERGVVNVHTQFSNHRNLTKEYFVCVTPAFHKPVEPHWASRAGSTCARTCALIVSVCFFQHHQATNVFSIYNAGHT